MITLRQLVDKIPGDELAEILLGLRVAGELEEDARAELLAHGGDPVEAAAGVEQLVDAAALRDSYVSRLLAFGGSHA